MMADPKYTSQAPDLTGQRFDRLLVQAFAYTKKGMRYWRCLCDCGKETLVLGSRLPSKITRSCGCLQQEKRRQFRRTHGMSGTSMHIRWRAMLARCLNPHNKSYPNYGGRGIIVCERWRTSFAAFYDDMGEPPEGMSLERRDNDGPYSPENCYWATAEQQQRNRQSTKFFTFNNETHSIPDWAEITGLSPRVLHDRLRWGWSIERALTTPLRPTVPDYPQGMLLTWQGETRTLRQWARALNIDPSTLQERLRKEWPLSQVFAQASMPTLVSYNGTTQSIAQWSLQTGIAAGVIRARLRLHWDVAKALTTPTRVIASRTRRTHA